MASVQDPSLTVSEEPTQEQADAAINSVIARLETLEAGHASQATLITNQAALIAAQAALNTTQASQIAALIAWQEELEDLRSVSIDIRDFNSRVDDQGFDNTPALNAMLLQAYSEQRADLFIPPGTWHCLTAINANASGSLPDQHKYNNISIRGLVPEWTVQHQEETGSAGLDLNNTFFSRIICHHAAGTVWWDQQRTYRFGPIRLQNLTIRSENQAHLFRIGDNTGSFLEAAFRGLYASACYFPCHPHITANWLTNGGADGWLLPTHLAYAFDILRGFDCVFTDCGFRGWGGAAVRTMNTDRLLMRNCKSILCPLIEDRKDSASIASVLEHSWAESPPFFGASALGKVTDFDGEMGYATAMNPDIGEFALPASVTWTIVQGGTYIQLASLPSGRTAQNYFRPGCFIRVEPNTTTQPLEATVGPRYLYVTLVEDTRVHFSNATGSSYIQWALSGLGDKIFRCWNILATFNGDQCKVNGLSLRFNEANPGRVYGVVPGRREIEISGYAELTGSLEAGNYTAYQPIVAASCAGIQSGLGGVALSSHNNAPDHPLVSFDGGPPFDANVRGPIWDEATNSQIFTPGRGVGAHSDNAKSLAFHRVFDATRGFAGQYVWLYRLSDHAAGWYLRRIRQAGKAVDYTINYYVPSGTPTMAVSGGTGADNNHVLLSGWNTVTGTLSAAQMAADSHGARVQLKSVSGVYIEKVVCFQSNSIVLSP